MNKKTIGFVASAAVLVIGGAAAVAAGVPGAAKVPSPVPAAGFQLGWYPNNSASYSTSEWSGLGVKPSYLTYYACVPGSSDATPLETSILTGANADGIGVFIKMDDDCGVPGKLPSVANGSDDSYLKAFGTAIASERVPVEITYDWEMNGDWNDYGPGGSLAVTPEEYIEAWNNVVTSVNSTDDGLVTWVWDVNGLSGGATPNPMSDYWSDGGQTVKDVGAIGVDSYLCLNQTTGSCSQTFDADIEPSVTAAKAVDPSLPVFLAETGIGGTSRNSELTSLVDESAADGLAGLMYFNSQSETLTTSEETSLGTAVAALSSSPSPSPSNSPTPTPSPVPVPVVTGPADVVCPTP